MGKKGVMISSATGGAYADTQEVIEDELEKIRQAKEGAMEEVPRDGFEFSAPIPNADERIAFIADPVVAERSRLERAVIEAAKKWRKSIIGSNPALVIAVNALNEFESNQQQVKK